MSDNEFVEFLRPRSDVKVSDFTRDGYRTVFVFVESGSEHISEEVLDKAVSFTFSEEFGFGCGCRSVFGG